MNHVSLRLGGLLCALVSSLLVGCTASSEGGYRAGLGAGFESVGKSSIEINDSVTGVVAAKLGVALPPIQAKADAAQAAAAAAQTTATSATQAASTATQTATAAQTEATKAKDKAAELSATLGITQANLAAAEAKLATLSADATRRLDAITADQLVALNGVKSDVSAFQVKLAETLSSAGKTDAEIKAFQEQTKGLSTEEIIALLVAAGAGGLMGKTGKSRAEPELAKMREKIETLQQSK